MSGSDLKYCDVPTLEAREYRAQQMVNIWQVRLQAIQAELDTRKAIDTTLVPADLAGFVTPEVPTGFDTFLGYLAKTNPEALRLMDTDGEATQRDGFWLMHRCRERSIEIHKAPACPVLQKQGIDEVNAYPIGLLAERLGS